MNRQGIEHRLQLLRSTERRLRLDTAVNIGGTAFSAFEAYNNVDHVRAAYAGLAIVSSVFAAYRVFKLNSIGHTAAALEGALVQTELMTVPDSQQISDIGTQPLSKLDTILTT